MESIGRAFFSTSTLPHIDAIDDESPLPESSDNISPIAPSPDQLLSIVMDKTAVRGFQVKDYDQQKDYEKQKDYDHEKEYDHDSMNTDKSLFDSFVGDSLKRKPSSVTGTSRWLFDESQREVPSDKKIGEKIIKKPVNVYQDMKPHRNPFAKIYDRIAKKVGHKPHYKPGPHSAGKSAIQIDQTSPEDPTLIDNSQSHHFHKRFSSLHLERLFTRRKKRVSDLQIDQIESRYEFATQHSHNFTISELARPEAIVLRRDTREEMKETKKAHDLLHSEALHSSSQFRNGFPISITPTASTISSDSNSNDNGLFLNASLARQSTPHPFVSQDELPHSLEPPRQLLPFSRLMSHRRRPKNSPHISTVDIFRSNTDGHQIHRASPLASLFRPVEEDPSETHQETVFLPSNPISRRHTVKANLFRDLLSRQFSISSRKLAPITSPMPDLQVEYSRSLRNKIKTLRINKKKLKPENPEWVKRSTYWDEMLGIDNSNVNCIMKEEKEKEEVGQLSETKDSKESPELTENPTISDLDISPFNISNSA